MCELYPKGEMGVNDERGGARIDKPYPGNFFSFSCRSRMSEARTNLVFANVEHVFKIER
jgi:hypothetical protein